MASSKASKDTIHQIKDIRPEDEKDCWPITKLFFNIMFFQQLLKLSPITLDTVTDFLLLRVYGNSTTTNHINNNGTHTKGQLISKANCQAGDSPKKRTDEFDLFALKSKKANKTNSSIRFLGESMARQSAFEIN